MPGPHKRAPCKQCGKMRVIRRDGQCYNCIAKAEREKPKNAPAKKPDASESVLDKLFGGPAVKSAPDDTVLPTKDKDKDKTKGKTEGAKPAGMPIIRPQLFLFIGAKLADLLDTKEFALDDDSAAYLADTCAAMLQEHGAEISPTMQFIIAMLMWLGMAFMAFAMKKYASSPDKERGGESIWETIKKKLNPEKVKPAFPPPMPVPVAPVQAQPQAEAIPQRQGEPVDPKWKPMDFTKMERQSQKEMLKNPSAQA